MIVPDLNLLVYAHNRHAPQHESALAWWQGLLDGESTVGLPWIVVVGFIRLMSNPKVVVSPLSPTAAEAYVSDWLSRPNITTLNPGGSHLLHLRQCLMIARSGPNLATDAHIAALAIEYDAELHSTDSGFSQFTGLRWRNPLRQEEARDG